MVADWLTHAHRIAGERLLEEFRSGRFSPAVPGSIYCPPTIRLEVDGRECVLSTRDVMQGIGARSTAVNYWTLEGDGQS